MMVGSRASACVLQVHPPTMLSSRRWMYFKERADAKVCGPFRRSKLGKWIAIGAGRFDDVVMHHVCSLGVKRCPTVFAIAHAEVASLSHFFSTFVCLHYLYRRSKLKTCPLIQKNRMATIQGCGCCSFSPSFTVRDVTLKSLSLDLRAHIAPDRK